MRRLPLLLAMWVATRAAMILGPAHALYPHVVAVTGDVRLYERWAVGLAAGNWPATDPAWQYPPGAAALLVLPRLLSPQHYLVTFVGLMLIADAALLALLVRRYDIVSGWIWVLGTAALGPIVLHRFDVVPALLAVAGLSVPRLAGGGLLGVGALVKVWPALLLAVAGDRVRALFGAVLTGSAVLALLLVSGQLSDGLSFLRHQSARGLQIESVAATPYLLARALGAHGVSVRREYGAYQVFGPGVGLVVTLTTVATLAVVVGYVLLARRRPGDLALGIAALLAVLLVARVLSPQYLIWVIALAAVRRGPVAVLLVVAAGLSQLVYPLSYDALRTGDLIPALLLAARNLLLVVAAVTAWRTRSPVVVTRGERPRAAA